MVYTDMDDKLIHDTHHWQGLRPPLSPNEDEVKIYEEKCRGRGPVCMLGMTKELIHLCEYMVDLNPIKQVKPVISCDWGDLNSFAEIIIGDGVLNLAGLSLLEKLRRKCDVLVCRVFKRKFEGMKYATHFPIKFPGAKEVVETQPDIVMVTWEN